MNKLDEVFIRYSADTASFELNPQRSPVCYVNPGQEFMLETMNAFSQETDSEEELNDVIEKGKHHPFTGPVYINGALPGMTMAVTIKNINLASYVYTCISRSSGVLKGYFEGRNYKRMRIEKNQIDFEGVKLSVIPSLGGIGLADPLNTRNGATCKYGGNLDIRWLVEGTKVYLPIAIEGGLLYAGDLHALQGNGEPSGIALEASGTLNLTVNLFEAEIPTPILEVEQGIIVIGFGEAFEEAVKMAVDIASNILAKAHCIKKVDAYMLLGSISDIIIGHLTGRIKNVGVLVPHDILHLENVIGKEI
ncbi:acetamidase/formamidase family protein [Bacillus cereus group sp. MYBK108-2]|uniref:acetamidase/formamidase family protein n=1 Tax=Bacillus cereus group TaxID=86661 RepID=UPI000B4B32A3|nr:acetamidase/formamidase family protein [Bacillus cereus]HEF1900051.1 acetamidase/formamidase family protein [Bacillus cereus]